MTEHKRKLKWIEPRLQLRFFLTFITMVALATLLQTVVMHFMLRDIARGLPTDGVRLEAAMPSVLQTSVAMTFALLAPLTLALGIHQTFKVMGPLHRFRLFLRAIAAGEHPAPCKIRDRDELQDMCVLLNEAVERLRADGERVDARASVDEPVSGAEAS